MMASLAIGVWQVMASSNVTAKMGTVQQLTTNVRGLGSGAAN